MEKVYTFLIPASPDRVGEALCSEAFNTEVEKEREEVVSTAFVLVEENEERIVFEVRSEEYRRTKRGAIDRSTIERSANRNTYDRRARTLSWHYQGPGTKYVAVSGVYHLRADGDGTRIDHHVSIEVHIPLLGKLIARIVVKEFEKASRRFERVLSRHVAGPKASTAT